MSRGRGPRTGPPPPEGVHATYPPAGGSSCYLPSRGIEAGRRVMTAKLIRAPGNDAPIGGFEGDRRRRLVRGAALGNGERLQDLRGELQGRGAPRGRRARGAGDGGQRAAVKLMVDGTPRVRGDG